VIDSTSYNESEASAITVPSTYSVSSGLRQFTPGAITVDGIAIRVGARTGTTGTLSVELYNHTAGASVAGTEVTVNITDAVEGATVQADGGWMFFKFSAPILLLAATVYVIRVKTSTASQMSVYSGGSLATLCGFLRTTTTQAPVAGDDRFIMGEWTGAGAMTTRTVTLNDTVNVDYGSASTSQVTPALSISNGGIVLAGTTAATTYIQRISGNVVVYNGGILRLATSGSRMPPDSSFTWTFDCVSNVDFGIDIRRKGEFTAYGESKTRWTLLTADEAAASTIINVADTTGWKANDTLVFAPTGTTTTQGETKTILTVDSAVQVTLSAGLTNAHTGTGDVIGEVGNLTSNVKIVGTSISACTFIDFKESSLGVLDNVEIQYFGSNTTGKRGVTTNHINTSTNSVTFISCAFREINASSSTVVGSISAAGAFFYITNNVLYATGTTAGYLATGGSTGTPTFDFSSNLFSGASSSITGLTMSLVTGTGGTCTNNRIAGCTTGVSFATSFAVDTVSNISGFKVHSCTTGLTNGSLQTKTISSCDFVSNSTGVAQVVVGITTLTSCNFYGNTTSGLGMNSGGVGAGYTTLNSCIFRGRTSFAQAVGVFYSGSGSMTGPVIFNSCTFGVTTAHTTSDISATSYIMSNSIYNSCTFASTTEITSTIYTLLAESGSIQIQRKDDTDGNHVMYVRQGIITPDTSIFRTASPSIRIVPKSATITCSNKLASFKAYVANGQTCTPTVYVRESVVGDGTDYNGNFVKLYVKANHNLGITSDTLLDTATASSTGAWEALTGATSAVTDDGVLEFYVVLDGTTGWVNVDDFSFVNA
jgi:hypothetical protein